MAPSKDYKLRVVKGREDVEVFKPEERPGASVKSGDKKPGALPFSVEEEKPLGAPPRVIHGEPGQRDRRKTEVSKGAAAGGRIKSSLLADLQSELEAPTPPPVSPKKPPAPAKSEVPPAAPPAVAPPPAAAPPQPAPAAKKRKRMSTDPQEQGRMVAESVVGGFVGALRGQAARRGGMLSVDDVEALSSSFERQAEVLADTFSRQLKGFAEARNKSHWTHERVNSLNRLVVKKFSHLLVDETEIGKKPDGLSRRILPGFFHALEMMIGKEHLDEFDANANRIVDKLRQRHGAEFSWDHAYAHRDAKALILDLLVAIAPHFEELDKRLEWLRELINSNMPPAKPTSGKPDWTLDQIGLVRLLDAVFADLRTALEDDLGRLRITKRHGFEVLEALLEAFETFDKKIAAAAK